MQLGEIRSKCEHIAQAPIKPSVSERMHLLTLAKGVRATTAIEGNTLSDEQVQLALRGKLQVPPSQEYLKVEVDNVVHALDEVLRRVRQPGGWRLSLSELKDINRTVLEGLQLDDHVVPGEIRQAKVGVGNYGAPRADECLHLLERLCDWLNSNEFHPQEPDMAVPVGVVRAIVAHVYLAWIHPFGDGNGRTARAVELKALLAGGCPSPAAHLLSNHYNLTRARYYQELERASASGGDLLPFLSYAVEGLLDGLREHVETLWAQMYEIAWRDYVHERFGASDTKTVRRQRLLALALGEHLAPVPSSGVTLLNPALAAVYAQVSYPTLIRDLRALADMGLVRHVDAGYEACRDVMFRFRPMRLDAQGPTL